MIGNLVLDAELAKPPVVSANSTLGADCEHVADDQHPDHEFRVDRRPADLAVERLQLLSNVGQYPRNRRIDTAQKMARRNATFEVEQVEQLTLIDLLPTHHDPPPSLKPSRRRNHDSTMIASDFFNSIGPTRKYRSRSTESGYRRRAENFCSVCALPSLTQTDVS